MEIENKTQKRKRGENWSPEEKETLINLIAEARDVIHDRSVTKTVNLSKTEEWKSITNKFNKLMRKERKVGELKVAWKRLKLQVKLCTNDGEAGNTGDLGTMDMSPHDFYYGSTNEGDSDTSTKSPSAARAADADVVQEFKIEVCPEELLSPKICVKPNTHQPSASTELNRGNGAMETENTNNLAWMKRKLEIMEEEHQLTKKIKQLKIKKLELEILILQNEIH